MKDNTREAGSVFLFAWASQVTLQIFSEHARTGIFSYPLLAAEDVASADREASFLVVAFPANIKVEEKYHEMFKSRSFTKIKRDILTLEQRGVLKQPKEAILSFCLILRHNLHQISRVICSNGSSKYLSCTYGALPSLQIASSHFRPPSISSHVLIYPESKILFPSYYFCILSSMENLVSWAIEV